jgi:hypothetical protein
MKSGWLTSGPKVREFEKNFAEFIGGNVQAVSLNSATAGLTLALEAVGIGESDEVITTPFTFFATLFVFHFSSQKRMAGRSACDLRSARPPAASGESASDWNSCVMVCLICGNQSGP